MAIDCRIMREKVNSPQCHDLFFLFAPYLNVGVLRSC